MGPADWRVPPAAGLLVDRPAPPPRVLSAAAYCSRAPDDEGSVEVSVATVCRLEGSHCSLTSSCLLNVAHASREGCSQLLGAGYALGRLGEAGPPSSVSLAKGARRPWAVLAPVVGDIEVNMATVPRRTGDGRPLRRPVAMPAWDSGVVGCTAATPHLITVMWMQSWWVQSWPASGSRLSSWPASGSRSSWGRLPGVGHLIAFLGKVSETRSPSGSRPWG